eukprot:UN11604
MSFDSPCRLTITILICSFYSNRTTFIQFMPILCQFYVLRSNLSICQLNQYDFRNPNTRRSGFVQFQQFFVSVGFVQFLFHKISFVQFLLNLPQVS